MRRLKLPRRLTPRPRLFNMSPFDTIAAVSTPPGKGGVAVIRITGSEALKVIDRIFISAGGRRLSECKPRMQVYGYILDGDERVDDVLCTRFDAPRSYTGEDTVEIYCHGGILVTKTVLELALVAGARPAEAGEFTRRAFIGGRLSLTEAEAISDLLEATGREQLRLGATDARCALSKRISSLRSTLTALISSSLARIDYPDEDLGDFTDGEMLEGIFALLSSVDSLLATYRTGRAISEGIKAALVGKPNAGKSSIYNLLVGEDAAIVTDIPGTTRDLLESRVELGRVTLRLFDTAGIREENSADAVERIGIAKSREKIEKCELLFAIFDSSRPLDEDDRIILDRIKSSGATAVALLNKRDLEAELDPSLLSGYGFAEVLSVSATERERTLGLISEAVSRLFTDGTIRVGVDPVISSARQYASLLKARESLSYAQESLSAGFPQDAVSTDLERALGAISELDGRAVSEEVVTDIFSKFCVGK